MSRLLGAVAVIALALGSTPSYAFPVLSDNFNASGPGDTLNWAGDGLFHPTAGSVDLIGIGGGINSSPLPREVMLILKDRLATEVNCRP